MTRYATEGSNCSERIHWAFYFKALDDEWAEERARYLLLLQGQAVVLERLPLDCFYKKVIYPEIEKL